MKAVAQAFARYLPPKVVTNNALSLLMDTSDEWIQQRTGIKERRFVEEPITTSDLAAQAGRQSLVLAGEKSVDAIVAATLSPDYDFPGIGVLIQHKLGLPPIPAYDIRNQCTGFLYALEMAGALVDQGIYDRILVVGAEVHSTGLDLTTRGRDIAVLFGDGAGSCIVTRRDRVPTGVQSLQIIGSELHSDGEHASKLWCQHVGSAHFPTRITRELVDEGKCFPYMEGKRVFEHAVKRMTEVSLSVLQKARLTANDIRLVVPHQANARINQMVAAHLEVPSDRVFNTIEKYGNTTAATIPIGMSHALEEVPLSQGDIVLSCAFGSGFTWGATLLQVT